MKFSKMNFIIFCSIFVFFLAIFSSPNLWAQGITERELYDNNELFQQLSGAKQTLLELKFGKKQIPIQETLIISNEGREALQVESIQRPMAVNATDILINNNTGATTTSQFTQSETSILAFGNNIVASFNDAGSFAEGSKFTGFSYSTNGGATFTDGGSLPTNAIGDAGDPVFARNETTGQIYFSTLGFNSPGTIQVFRSTNNGISWLAPVNGTPGGSSEDKQWIAVDNFAGTGNGNVYLISRRFGGVPGIYMFRSTDNGNTFGPSGGILLVSNQQGAFVTVGPDHSVYAFWYDASSLTLKMRKSTDFGVSFATAVTVASGLTGPETNGGLGLTGIRNGLTTASGFRSNSFPHAAVNPISGHLYVVFNDNPAGGDKGDVYLVKSTNGGTTWGAPVRVNDDATTTDQWQPTIAVAPNGMSLGIFYYSRQQDPTNNNLFKYYGRTASISGSNVVFTPSFAVSDVASLPEFGRDAIINATYMGDYNHVSASPGKFHVLWSDNRSDLAGGGTRKDPNVYYESIPAPQNQFLVWDGALGGQDYSGAFINSFITGLGYTADYTSVFPTSLIGYDAVFLSFGMYPNNTSFNATMAAAVQTYLATGGKVYLEGNDALEFNQGTNVPLHELFGLGDGSDGGTNIIDGLQGQVGSLTDGMLFTASSQVNNGFTDIYVPTTGTIAFIESGYGNVGIQYSGSFGQRTFCFSHTLAGLTDASFPSTKNELMTRILNFLVGPSTLPPDISVTPTSLTFTVPEGGADSGVLTINNIGQQNLVWNVLEQEVTLAGIKLKLDDGRELPVTIQPKFEWKQPVKGNDYVPYPTSAGRPPSDLSFNQLYENETTQNQLLFAKDAFGNDETNGNFVQFDLGTPDVLNPVSTFIDWVWAGDFGTDLTFAYAVNYATNQFIQIDKTTGGVTVIGPCAPTQNPPSEIFTGMAIDPTSGTVYLSSTDITTSWLYTVNTTTGAPTLVGPLTNAPGMIAIAINNNGQMYGYEILGDVMLIVNKFNGAGTVLGPLGFDANFGQGMDFDPITGTLYLTAYNGSTGPELRIGNTVTGNTTLVGPLGSTIPGGSPQVGWVGLPGENFDCPWLAESPVSGSVSPGGSQNMDIFVDATGLTAGTYNCNLVITNNDPSNPQVTVPVTLNVTAPPPDINVTPTSLTFNVPEGGTDNGILTIANTAPAGNQDLNWNIYEENLALRIADGRIIPVKVIKTENASLMSTTGPITVPQTKQSLNSNQSMTEGHEKYSNLDLDSYIESAKNYNFSPDAIPASVLIVASDEDPTFIRSYLDAFPDISVVDYFDARVATPSLAQLQPYDVVVAWTNFQFFDPVGMGNILADYVDTGGRVILTSASFSLGWPLQGRFMTDGYSAFIPGNPFFATLNLGSYNPAHPIMAGVTTLSEYFACNVTLDAGALLVASFDNSTPFVATKGAQVVCVNGFFSDSYAWTGDMPLVLHNAIIWAGGGPDVPWISENPLSGIIPAGSSQDIAISVDAAGLVAGTQECNLIITSNDPDENPVIVPVRLNVITTGPPPENFAIVTNSEDNSINTIDIATNTITGPFLGGSLGFSGLLDPVITPDGQTALISNFGDQTVFFVDLSNANNPSVLGSVNIGFFAEDIDLTPDGAFALVTDGSGSAPIAVIDVASRSLIQSLDISPRSAQAVAIAPNGTVLVAQYVTNQVHVFLLNLSTGLLTDPATAITVGLGPINIAIGPDGQTALVANATATSVDVLQITGPGSVSLTGSVPNILNVQSIAFETNGTRAFALETGTNPDQLAVLSVTSPGNVIDLGNRISLLTNGFGGYYGVDVIDVSADGNWAYVGNPGIISPGNKEVAVVDLTSYTISTTLTAGNYPVGIAVGGVGMVGDFAANFLVSDNCANSQNLIFGTAPDATDGFDPAYDQFAPPAPPSGAFDGRFRILSEDYLKDFRATNPDGVRIWDVYYQPETSCGPVTLSWDPTELPADGNFHLVDPITGALVNVNMRTTSTYTDVIGLGHLQILFNYEVAVDYNMAAGWNMISLPLVVADPNYLTLFPNAVPGTLYGFNGSYYSTTTVGNNTGYWLRYPSPEIVQVQGIEITGSTINLSAGWNMIGGPNCSVPVGSIGDPSGVIIPGTLYGFNGSYYSATSVDAGQGYWVRANAPGQITINCGAPLLAKGQNDLTLPVNEYNDFSKVEIRDGNENTQALYFNGELNESVNIESFSLPPVAPNGVFDVRLAGGYRLSESQETSIYVQASQFPLSVTVTNLKAEEGYSYVLKEMVNNVSVQEHNVADGTEILVSNDKVTMLVLTKQQAAVPTSFDLAQNYPNPFNPSTLIKYALPETRNVELIIYNALGEKIKSLVSGVKEAGFYTTIWDGTNDYGNKVVSGMYIYSLRAGDYSSVKKMMLLK